MAKGRLSKLQKCILLLILDLGYIYRREIYQVFWQLDIPESKEGPPSQYKKIDNSKCVILSRSLKNLEKKNYIRCKRWTKRHSYQGIIELTKKGEEKAKELQNSGLKISSLLK